MTPEGTDSGRVDTAPEPQALQEPDLGLPFLHVGLPAGDRQGVLRLLVPSRAEFNGVRVLSESLVSWATGTGD